MALVYSCSNFNANRKVDELYQSLIPYKAHGGIILNGYLERPSLHFVILAEVEEVILNDTSLNRYYLLFENHC